MHYMTITDSHYAYCTLQNASLGCTLQARKPAEQQNWQDAAFSESCQGSGQLPIVVGEPTWNNPNSVYPRVGSVLEQNLLSVPTTQSLWHVCCIRCFHSSSKWRNGNLFSYKVLLTIAGTHFIITTRLEIITFVTYSQTDIHSTFQPFNLPKDDFRWKLHESLSKGA